VCICQNDDSAELLRPENVYPPGPATGQSLSVSYAECWRQIGPQIVSWLLIGEGGMATVSRSGTKASKVTRALKILKNSSDKELRTVFLQKQKSLQILIIPTLWKSITSDIGISRRRFSKWKFVRWLFDTRSHNTAHRFPPFCSNCYRVFCVPRLCIMHSKRLYTLWKVSKGLSTEISKPDISSFPKTELSSSWIFGIARLPKWVCIPLV